MMVALARQWRYPGPPGPALLDWSSQTWRQHPQARGLYAWWPTLSSVGNRLREAVQGVDATGQNGAAMGTAPVVGFAANNFTGSTGSRYWSAPLSWPGGPITVSFWNRVPSGSPNGCGFGSNTSVPNKAVDRFQCHAPFGDGTLYWDYGNASGTGRVSADYSPHYDQWTHVVLTSGGGVTAYKAIACNGHIVASDTSSASPTASAVFEIGRWYDSVSPYIYHTGMIADFRIYNRVLSAAEIWQLYNPQTRWALLPARSNRRWFIPTSPPGPSLNVHRRRPGIIHPGSRSVIAC